MTSERSDILQIFIRANTAMKVARPYVFFLRGICVEMENSEEKYFQ